MTELDTYEVYFQWCIDHKRIPPTREWWDRACSKSQLSESSSELVLDQAEFDRERREGWAYGD